MKKLFLISVLLNAIFFIWVFNGKYSDGDIGMQPYFTIGNSILTLAILIILVRLFKVYDSKIFAIHFITFQVASIFVRVLLNGYFDLKEVSLLHLFEKTLLGYVARGLLVSCLSSYLITYFIYKLMLKKNDGDKLKEK